MAFSAFFVVAGFLGLYCIFLYKCVYYFREQEIESEIQTLH